MNQNRPNPPRAPGRCRPPRPDANSRLRDAIETLGLTLPTLLVYLWLITEASDFWLRQPDLRFGWGVLCLGIYLWLDAWRRRPPMVFRLNGPVAALFATGLVWVLLSRVHRAALGATPANLMALALGSLLIASSNSLYLFGPAGIRHFLFAQLFLWVALPMPTPIQGTVIAFLKGLVIHASITLLNLAGVPSVKTGSLIHLARGTLGIEDACSGIRGLQASVMAALFIGHLASRNLVVRSSLVGLGIGCALLGNILRILILATLLCIGGKAWLSAGHDPAGWLVAGLPIAVLVLATRQNKSRKQKAESRKEDYA